MCDLECWLVDGHLGYDKQIAGKKSQGCNFSKGETDKAWNAVPPQSNDNISNTVQCHTNWWGAGPWPVGDNLHGLGEHHVLNISGEVVDRGGGRGPCGAQPSVDIGNLPIFFNRMNWLLSK